MSKAIPFPDLPKPKQVIRRTLRLEPPPAKKEVAPAVPRETVVPKPIKPVPPVPLIKSQPKKPVVEEIPYPISPAEPEPQQRVKDMGGYIVESPEWFGGE